MRSRRVAMSGGDQPSTGSRRRMRAPAGRSTGCRARSTTWAGARAVAWWLVPDRPRLRAPAELRSDALACGYDAPMHALLLRIAVLGPVWLYHPLGNCTGTHAERTRCLSYNFWSGIGSDLAYITTIAGAVFVAWRSYKRWRKLHECHEEGCKLIGTFQLPSGARACLIHHPHLDAPRHRARAVTQAAGEAPGRSARIRAHQTGRHPHTSASWR